MQEDELRSMRSREALLDLIQHVSPRLKEPEMLVDRLLDQFGSLIPLMNADPSDLMRIPGMNRPIAELLNMLPALTRYVRIEETGSHPVLNCLTRAGEYLKPLYIGLITEKFYLLCLDRRGKLIRCVLLQDGTLDQTVFSLRQVMEAAFRSQCHAVVLSHNHPSGTAEPSRGDTGCTLDAVNSLSLLGVVVLDHVIIADGNVVSMRKTGILSEAYMRGQNKNDPLLCNWLCEPDERKKKDAKRIRLHE